MQMVLVQWTAWVFNSCFSRVKATRRLCGDLYRTAVTEPTWMITQNGAYFDTANFNSEAGDGLWIYKNNLLYMDLTVKKQRIPLLSCEFTYKETTYSLDGFLEDLYYSATAPPPLPVLMAAYTIHSREVRPWWTANFTAFTKTGAQIQFPGDTKLLPVA